MTRVYLAACLLGNLLFAGPLLAEDPFFPAVLAGESRNTGNLVDDARKSLADQKWPEAVDQFQALIDKGADDLVALDVHQALQARRLAQFWLARSSSAPALALYRARVDPQARRWLEQGLEQHQERWLRKLVDEAFCSRPAEKALDTLGDLAFERGQFAEAEHWWRLLVPPLRPLPPAKALPDRLPAAELQYPDPQTDPARIRAKQLLAQLFQETMPQREGTGAWETDLKAFQEKHGKAEGNLAGRSGRYVDILRGLARDKPQRPLDLPWETCGGDATRGLVMPAPANLTDRLGILCRQPRFCYSLEKRKRLERPSPLPDLLRALDQYPVGPSDPRERGRVQSITRTARSLAFFPVIAGGQVITADARYVTGYDLRTGVASEWFDAARDNGGIKPDLQLPAPADLRYTLTVADDCVFARLGTQGIQCPDPAPPQPGKPPLPRSESLLVCLSLKPGAGGERLRWQLRPGIANDNAVFEGAPVVSGGQVYVAVSRFSADRTITAIHCYPASVFSTPPFTPPLRWRKDICETREPRSNEKRYRHHLLTLAGPVLVYCSHSGAIVGLDAASGRRLWGLRYPPRPAPPHAENEPPLTDLTPCLCAGGRLYAAPADSDRLLCLDPGTGRTLWERTRINVVHLLGVGHDRLIFTTPTGLRAVRAADGSDEQGWLVPGSDKLAPMGRGLLLGDLVLWPTISGVHAIRQQDGQPPDNPTLLHNLPPGNLAYGQGCLAVADRTILSVFVAPGWQLPQREQESRRQPDSAEPLIRLAESEADAGNTAAALTSLTRAEQFRTRLPQAESEKTGKQIIQVRQETFLEAATQRAAARRWQEAEAFLKDASAEAFPAPLRLEALVRLAELGRQSGQLGRSVAAWRAILKTEALRRQMLADGITNAGLHAAGQLRELKRQSPDPFTESEREAESEWNVAFHLRRGEEPPAKALRLEKFTRPFPDSVWTRPALRELIALYERAQKPGAAADVYRRLLPRVAAEPEEEARCLIGLARAYERQQCWNAARSVWQQLERLHKDSKRSELDSQRVGDYVARHLSSPAFEHHDLDQVSAPLLPLFRSWNISLPDREILLAGPASAERAAVEMFFCVRDAVKGGQLVCRKAANGEERWRCALPFVPRWVGLDADVILAAGPGGVAGVRLDDGGLLWDFQPPQITGGISRFPTPFWELSGFQLHAGRLFCLQGDRRLMVLQPESGRVIWTCWAPGGALGPAVPEGRFFPGYRMLGKTILLQTGTGRRWLLDTDGRKLQDVPADRTPWPVLTLAQNGTAADLIQESGRLVRLGPASGSELWRQDLPGSALRSGEPVQLLATTDSVLVVTPTNLGQRLEKLDLATGKAAWDKPLYLPADRLDLARCSVDKNAVYLVADGQLSGRSLADGKLLWERPLAGPPGSWQTQLVRGSDAALADTLLVYPAETPARRIELCWLLGSLQWIVSMAPEAQMGQGCPIHCFDPATGIVVQRLNVPAGLPCMPAEHAGRLERSRGQVMPEIKVGESLRPSRLVVRVVAGGLVVGLGGQVFGLRTSEK